MNKHEICGFFKADILWDELKMKNSDNSILPATYKCFIIDQIPTRLVGAINFWNRNVQFLTYLILLILTYC